MREKPKLAIYIAYPDQALADILGDIVAQRLHAYYDLHIVGTSYVSPESNHGLNAPAFDLASIDEKLDFDAFIVGVNRPSSVEVVRKLAALYGKPILVINSWSPAIEFARTLRNAGATDVLQATPKIDDISDFFAFDVE
jgi:hypothetical protein